MNTLGRLIEVIPNGVFGPDKNRLINEAPYVVLISDAPSDIAPPYDFELKGKIEWCKHRKDAIKESKNIDIESLFVGNSKNFKLAFCAAPVDLEKDSALDILYASKLVLRGLAYYEDNLVKMVVLRNIITHNSLSEHLIYMDKATV